ncbi:hypothetical protein LEI94_24145 [Salmonella enterica]|nr:hypothetical protein [Salmonella enterica]
MRLTARQPYRRAAGSAGYGATGAAHPVTDAAGRVFSVRDGSPKGGDGLPAPFTTARPGGGRPEEQQQKREQYQEEEKQNDDNGRQKSSP